MFKRIEGGVNVNQMECGKCGYFDGMMCRKHCVERYEDDIIKDCKYFEYSIYYQ